MIVLCGIIMRKEFENRGTKNYDIGDGKRCSKVNISTYMTLQKTKKRKA